MEFKGTKGKWVAKLGSKSETSRVKIGSMEIELEIDYQDKLDEERANALLISKAPEMLEQHQKEIEFLKKLSRHLIDLDDFMLSDVLDLIETKKQLIKEATEI